MSTAPLKTANLDEKLGEVFIEHFTQQLTLQPGLRVSSAADVVAVLGLERQKQLIGCADASSSCVAELAGALGVDVLVTGTIAKVGSAYTVNLRALSANDAKTLSVVSERSTGDDALLELLDRAAVKIAEDVRGAPDAVISASSPPLRGKAWIPAAAGLAAGIVAVTLLVLANNTATRISVGDSTITTVDQLDRAIGDGKLQAGGCVVATVTAGVAVAAAIAMYFFGATGAPAQLSAWLAPGAGGLGVGATFP